MTQKPPKHFAVITIPLNREEIVDFLLPPEPEPKGAKIQIVGQRPSPKAEAKWIKRLRAIPQPTVADYLAIDNPHHNVYKTYTDRLVPLEFLERPGFLTRNFGGWSPVFFGVARLPASFPPGLAAKFPAQLSKDPLLKQLRVLADYGPEINYFGTNPQLVAPNVEQETGYSWPEFCAALFHLYDQRPQAQTKSEMTAARMAYVERLFEETVSGRNLAAPAAPPVPKILLYEELLSQMRLLELARRQYRARHKQKKADAIREWQEKWREETGAFMIVKGEYIAGRHRGSLVLVAPELGVVIKQPAPEPFHQIELDARMYKGRMENWPYLVHNGALVTSRGRVRLLLEDRFVPRLHQVFNHPMTFSTLLGFTQEAYVPGQTVQEAVLADYDRLTADLYDTILLHQQTCEALGVENGDWHAANFIIRDGGRDGGGRDGGGRDCDRLVHIDWGAARPLREYEKTANGFYTRLNQVQNLAYSFHNDYVAHRVNELHQEFMNDKERQEKIWQKAQELAAAKAGVS